MKTSTINTAAVNLLTVGLVIDIERLMNKEVGAISINNVDEFIKAVKKSPKKLAVKEQSQDSIELSNRTKNMLTRNSIDSIEALREMSSKDIKALKGAGRTVIMEIEAVLGRQILNPQGTGKVGRPSKAHVLETDGIVLPESEDSILGKGLSTRTFNVLKNRKLLTISDVKSADLESLSGEKGVGKSVMAEIYALVGMEAPKVEKSTVADGRGRPPKKVEELKLSEKTLKVLHKNGINFLKELKAADLDSLQQSKESGFTKKVVTEISEALKIRQKRININTLNLSARTLTALNKNGIRFLDQLNKVDEEEIKSLSGIGKASFNEITNFLKSVAA